MVEERVTDVADFGRPLFRAAGNVLRDALGAEDTSAVATVVLLLVHRKADLTTLTTIHIVLVLPADLKKNFENVL